MKISQNNQKLTKLGFTYQKTEIKPQKTQITRPSDKIQWKNIDSAAMTVVVDNRQPNVKMAGNV